MSYSSEVLADSPVGYWRCDEASGLIQDSSGNGNHATATVGSGSATYQQTGGIASDTASKSIRVTDNAFSVPDHATLDVGDVFTLECWVRFFAISGNATLMTKQSGSFELRVDSTGAVILIRESVAVIVTSTDTLAADGGFHHIVATKNGATIKLYIDSLDVTGTVTDSTMVSNASDLRLGGYFDSTNDVDGWIDEYAIYATALSAARVQAHYDAAGATSSSGRVPTNTRVPTDTLVPGSLLEGIRPQGIASAEAFGTPTIRRLSGVGQIASGEAFGVPLVNAQNLGRSLGAFGIPSGEAFGSAMFLKTPKWIRVVGGIVSEEVFGTQNVGLRTVTLRAVGGIASGESVGTPRVAGLVPGGAGLFLAIEVRPSLTMGDAQIYEAFAFDGAVYTAAGSEGLVYTGSISDDALYSVDNSSDAALYVVDEADAGQVYAVSISDADADA